MIKKLVIENFQSHEKAELNLAPGVNVITGVSQSGKTAILRALYWLLHNRPSGERIRSSFAEGATKVMIETDDGHRIWHVKDSKVNSYTIGDNLFDKIGRDIPDMVQRALRISELNVQKQLDEPFLVTSSAGEVAKTINRITRLEMVDQWVTDLTQTINSTNRETEQLEIEIESHAEKIKSYRVLVDLQPLLDKAKTIDKKITDKFLFRGKISELVVEIDYHSGEFIKLNSKVNLVTEILGRIDLISDQVQKRSERAKVARSALKAYQTTQRLKSALEPIKNAGLIENRKAELNQKSKIIVDARSKFDYWQKAQKIAEAHRLRLFDEIRKVKTCPTCLQPINEKTIKKIMGTS